MVASPGTEGFNDFLGQLHGSGLAFTVMVVPAQVQGASAPAALARGIAAAGRGRLRPGRARPRRRLQGRPGGLRLRTRGSGHRSLWRARVDRHRTYRGPVGGRHRRRSGFRDPDRVWPGARSTSPGLVGVGGRPPPRWWPGGPPRSSRTPSGANATARARLAQATRHQLHRHDERLDTRARRVAAQARRQLDLASTTLDQCVARIGPGADRAVEHHLEKLAPGGASWPPTTWSASSNAATP